MRSLYFFSFFFPFSKTWSRKNEDISVPQKIRRETKTCIPSLGENSGSVTSNGSSRPDFKNQQQLTQTATFSNIKWWITTGPENPLKKRSSAPKSNTSPFGYGTTWHYSCPPDKVLMCYTPTSKKTYRFFFFHPPPRLNFPNLHILFGCATSKRTQKEMKRGHKEANRSLSSVFKRLSLPSASVKKYRRWSNKKHVMKTKPSCPFLAQQCQTPPIFSSSFFSSLASWGLNVGLLSPPFFEPFDLIDDHWFNCQRKSCQGEIRNGRRNSTGW